MKKTYTLRTGTTESDTEEYFYGSKKTAIKYGDESGLDYVVLSPAGAVVHEVSNQIGEHEDIGLSVTAAEAETVPESDPIVDKIVEKLYGDDEEDLIGEDEPGPEAQSSFTFPGNYAIAFIPFAERLADSFSLSAPKGGELSYKEEKTAGLARVFHFSGSAASVNAFADLLEDVVPATLEELHTWQKENRDRRRTLTDMEKYLEHRQFILDAGKKLAEAL